MKIKKKYGCVLEKLLIYTGDWHLLKNFQEVLMRQYYYSGLKEIAMSSGYKGSTLRSLEACSHFKHTHFFLLNVWEALYKEMYESYRLNMGTEDPFTSNIINEEDAIAYTANVGTFIDATKTNEKFIAFIDKQSGEDDIWKYWSKFVLFDCFCYIQLYLAIRDGNWVLRLSAIKAMAPLFAAFDQSIYMQIIPHHLNEIMKYPQPILECLEKGAFTVSLTGQNLNQQLFGHLQNTWKKCHYFLIIAYKHIIISLVKLHL
jgi:hypothetical protein